MGTDTLLYMPQPGVDAASVPFVFDDGVLSFYTPSPESSDTGSSVSPPVSSASSASFLGVLPHRPRYCRLDSAPVFHGLSIGGDEITTPIYAQTNSGSSSGVASLDNLDPSMTRYSPIHAALSHLQCQFMHVDIPLAATAITEHYPITPTITIATSLRGPVLLMTTLYSQGTLVSLHEVEMEAQAQPHSSGTSYSAPFPHELVDKLCKEAKWGPEREADSDGSYSVEDALDSVVVLQLLQQDEKATFGDSEEETMLVVVCDFYAYNGPLPGKIKALHLLPGTKPPQTLPSSTKCLPTPPPSHEHLNDLKGNVPSSIFSRRQRFPPKLSVAIPPPSISMHGTKGCIELCCDSRPSPDSSIRLTPQTGVPQNVLPATPFEQLIHTPLYPPEIPRSTRSRAGYAPTPTESAYPFTLSSTSPGTAQSPAFAVLDPTCRLSGSAPAWLTLHRNAMPFTPSIFLQHPHTASASNAMSSITQRAIDAGTPTFPGRPHKGEYLDQPLASPPLISSAPLFPTAPTDSDSLGSGWPSSMRSPQSS